MMASLITNVMLFSFWSPGPVEMMLLAAVALLLYGGNLPQVARSWGKSLTEFRRGLSGIQNEINDVIYSEPEPGRLEYRPESTRPKETTSDQAGPEETASDASIGSRGAGDYGPEGYGTEDYSSGNDSTGNDSTGNDSTGDDSTGDDNTGDDNTSTESDSVVGPDVS